MIGSLLLVAALVWAAPEVSDADRQAYEAARVQAGRDADAHVRLALWCEARGMSTERAKHLSIARMIDPANVQAKSLQGMVEFDGRWMRPERVAEQVQADPERAATLEAYRARRAETPFTADAQWKLGLWCEERGLKTEATAHFTHVTRLDPSREAAWKRLGYRKDGRRWIKPEQLAAEKARAEEQRLADKHWKPLLTKYRGWLADSRHQAEAEAALTAIDDPRAVPSVMSVFSLHAARDQAVAVQVLGQIDSPAASQGLALLAVFGKSPDVQRIASETLRQRDPRDFGGLLIGLIRDPIKYTVRQVGGPGSPGELFIEGKDANLKRVYTPPPVYTPEAGDQIGLDPQGTPAVMRDAGFRVVMVPQNVSPERAGRDVREVLTRSGLSPAASETIGRTVASNVERNKTDLVAVLAAQGRPGGSFVLVPQIAEVSLAQIAAESERAAQAAQARLAGDVDALQRLNAPILERNRRVIGVLADVAGQNLGDDRESWQLWFTDLMGAALQPRKATAERPTMIEDVPLAFQSQLTPQVIDGALRVVRHGACFAAGTPVWTREGLVPIETVRSGDTVLSRTSETGALGYRAVVTAYHNPPNETFEVDLGGESIVATGIHRFWKAGKGWTMARDLKPGDQIRALEGVATVARVTSAGTQPVFNLSVADGDSFLVGKQGYLVHDNSAAEPVIAPFDGDPTQAKAMRDDH